MDKITLPNGTSYNSYTGEMSALYLLEGFNGKIIINQREMGRHEALSVYRENGYRGDMDFSCAGKVYVDILN